MHRYLILLIFILSYSALAQDSVDSITPRYVVVEKKDGTYKYHQINKLQEDGSYSPKIKKQRIMIHSDDGFCLTINDFKHLTLKRHLKNEVNHPFSTHGYVIKESDIQKIYKKNPAPRYACPNETSYPKVKIKPGISKSLSDKINDQETLSQNDIKESIKDNVWLDKVEPYHKVCDEIVDLKKMIQSLKDRGYIKVSMKTKDKTIILPIHTGTGTPYIFTKHYKLHKDHKIPYYRRNVELELTNRGNNLIEEAEAFIAKQEAAENALLLEQFQEVLGEEIVSTDNNSSLVPIDNAQEESKRKLPPYLLLPALKKHFEYYQLVDIDYPNNRGVYKKLFLPKEALKKGGKLLLRTGKWVKRAAIELIAIEAVLQLFNSATDPNEREKILEENPLNVLGTIDELEERKACRRMLYHPEAYLSLYSLLAEIETYYYQFEDYEALMEHKETLEMYNDSRSPGKLPYGPLNKEQSKKVYGN